MGEVPQSSNPEDVSPLWPNIGIKKTSNLLLKTFNLLFPVIRIKTISHTKDVQSHYPKENFFFQESNDPQKYYVIRIPNPE